MSYLQRATFTACCMAFTAFAEQANEQQQQQQDDQQQKQDQTMIYAAVGASVALVGSYLAYKAFAKEEEIEQLVAEDVVPGSNNDKDVFEGMHKELDQAGSFEKQFQGTLDFDSMCKLRRIITKYANKVYTPKKEELMKQRLVHFKAKQWKEYSECIRQSTEAFNSFMKEYTLEACRWINLEEVDYINTWRECMQNEESRKTIERIETEERQKDEDREVSESEQLIITIFKEKISKEFQLDLQLRSMQANMQPQMMQGIALVEKTKIVDDLYSRYGIKLLHLMKCAQHYKLQDHPEIKKLEGELKEKAMAAVKKAQEATAMDPEFESELKEEITKLGPVRKNDQNMIEWDYFLAAKELILKFGFRAIEGKNADSVQKRRALLREKKMQEYSIAIQQSEGLKQQLMMKITQQVFTTAGLDNPQIFQASTQAYMQQPDKRAEIEQIAKKHLKEPTSGKELSREKTLQTIQKIEEQKLMAMLKNQHLVQMKKIPPQQFGQIMVIEKTKTFDDLAIAEGIEEGDISASFDKYDLKDSDDYKNLMAEVQQKAQNQMPQQRVAPATNAGGQPQDN